MRSRDEVLREFTRTVEHCEFASDDVLDTNAMADRIRELEARGVSEVRFGNVQRYRMTAKADGCYEEYHAEGDWVRFADLPQPASGEPVAWAAMFTNGEYSHVIWNERSAREWAAQSETRVVRPLVFGDALPSAAGVTVTEAQCEAIVNGLDSWARDVDSYEFGLPMYGRDDAYAVVRAALGASVDVNDVFETAQRYIHSLDCVAEAKTAREVAQTARGVANKGEVIAAAHRALTAATDERDAALEALRIALTAAREVQP